MQTSSEERQKTDASSDEWGKHGQCGFFSSHF